jgi:hypothetical protein
MFSSQVISCLLCPQFEINIFMRSVCGSLWNHVKWYHSWRNITASDDCPTFKSTIFTKPKTNDSVLAQAVSPRLPTAAGPVWCQVRSCGICGGQSSIGASFLRERRFPLPILIPLNVPYSSINRVWYNSPISGDVPGGLSVTTPHKTKKKYNVIIIIIYFRAHKSYSEYMMMYDGKYETWRWIVNEMEWNALQI